MSHDEIEFRAAQVADVSFPTRTIELIVMPYEQQTQVPHHGRLITEVVTRGAFDGAEKRRIRVNRDHDFTRTVGKVAALHPSREEGLVAEIKISPTDLGDETLALADDEVLDASAGFGLLVDKQTGKVRKDAEVWETQSRRRLNALFLHHVAMTPDPAYTGARVLSVRAAERPQEAPGPVARPNLDRFHLVAAKALEADIDRRYGLS